MSVLGEEHAEKILNAEKQVSDYQVELKHVRVTSIYKYFLPDFDLLELLNLARYTNTRLNS